jgi:hypothetical protein
MSYKIINERSDDGLKCGQSSVIYKNFRITSTNFSSVIFRMNRASYQDYLSLASGSIKISQPCWYGFMTMIIPTASINTFFPTNTDQYTINDCYLRFNKTNTSSIFKSIYPPVYGDYWYVNGFLLKSTVILTQDKTTTIEPVTKNMIYFETGANRSIDNMNFTFVQESISFSRQSLISLLDYCNNNNTPLYVGFITEIIPMDEWYSGAALA